MKKKKKERSKECHSSDSKKSSIRRHLRLEEEARLRTKGVKQEPASNVTEFSHCLKQIMQPKPELVAKIPENKFRNYKFNIDLHNQGRLKRRSDILNFFDMDETDVPSASVEDYLSHNKTFQNPRKSRRSPVGYKKPS